MGTITEQISRISSAATTIKNKTNDWGLTDNNGNAVSSSSLIDKQAEGISKITTKSTSSISVSTEDQTISSGTYLTGDQTIKGVTLTGDSSKIIEGNNVHITSNGNVVTSIEGSLKVIYYYVGESVPENGFGNDGEIYLVISGSGEEEETEDEGITMNEDNGSLVYNTTIADTGFTSSSTNNDSLTYTEEGVETGFEMSEDGSLYL